MNRTGGLSTPNHSTVPTQTPKKRRFIAFADPCSRVSRLPTLGEAMDVLRDTHLGNPHLMFRAGWIHRDVVANVLAIKDESAGASPHAKLSCELKRTQPRQPHNLTEMPGTPYFMACELLTSESLYSSRNQKRDRDRRGIAGYPKRRPHLSAVVEMHTYAHDTESLWWIILWILTNHVRHEDSYRAASCYFQQSDVDRRRRLFQYTGGIALPILHPDLRDFLWLLEGVANVLLGGYEDRHPKTEINELYAYISSCAIFCCFFEDANEKKKRVMWGPMKLPPVGVFVVTPHRPSASSAPALATTPGDPQSVPKKRKPDQAQDRDSDSVPDELQQPAVLDGSTATHSPSINQPSSVSITLSDPANSATTFVAGAITTIQPTTTSREVIAITAAFTAPTVNRGATVDNAGSSGPFTTTMNYYPLDPKVFLSISLCLATAWLYRSRKEPLSKSASQAVLLGHSLFILYSILVAPPRNVFRETGSHANTPSDTLRSIYLHRSPDGELEPGFERVFQKLNSFDMRLLYLQLGHNTIADCDFCHSWEEYVSFTLVRSIFAYILEIALVGAFTLPNSSRAHLRSFVIGILMIALVVEVVATVSASDFIAPQGMENPLITRWHDTIDLARSLLFLILPLSLYMPRIPLIYHIPILNNFLPYPDPRSSLPRTAERLRNLQATLDTFIPRLHLLSYTRAAIIAVPLDAGPGQRRMWEHQAGRKGKEEGIEGYTLCQEWGIVDSQGAIVIPCDAILVMDHVLKFAFPLAVIVKQELSSQSFLSCALRLAYPVLQLLRLGDLTVRTKAIVRAWEGDWWEEQALVVHDSHRDKHIIQLAVQESEKNDELLHILGTRIVGYSYASAIAFLIYDILLTLPDEVQFVWPMRPSFTKAAFFFIRYFPPLLGLSTQFYGAPLPNQYSDRACYVWNVYQGLGLILTIVAVDYILILRVFAMYPRNTPIRATTALLYASEIVTMSVGFGIGIPQLRFDDRCVTHDSPPIVMVASGFPILYQAFLFVATAVRFYFSLKAGWGNIPILHLLMRDGTWAFVVLFAVLVTEALLYSVDVDAYTGFLYGWANTAFSICGYRIIINMNKLNRSSNQPIVSTSPEIQFTSVDVMQYDSEYQMTDLAGAIRAHIDTRQRSTYRKLTKKARLSEWDPGKHQLSHKEGNHTAFSAEYTLAIAKQEMANVRVGPHLSEIRLSPTQLS
ncbi:hypothetical protein NMY22_g5861 [Coprinellus aureogranulatus]|nr:hypothetical protein NMY22_g5861 [Coprinellus aureogranulatus]